MFAIFKREIRSYFQTVVGWLFIAAVLALYGLYFYAYNLRSGSPYVSYSLSAVSFIVMIAVPVLTMRSFAEERHTKTDQLMLTSPVPLGKIVFGKAMAKSVIVATGGFGNNKEMLAKEFNLHLCEDFYPFMVLCR